MSINKLLLLNVITKGYSLWDRREYLISRPQFDKYYDRDFLESTLEKRWSTKEDLLYTQGNAGGEFIAQNISTPSKVIFDIYTIDQLKNEIEDFKPTHVGFSVLLSAYELFKEFSTFIRKNYPHIKIIAGDVGALVPETSRYADYVCRGEGSQFIRRILGEDTRSPLQIPCTTMIRYRPNPLNPKKFVPNTFGVLSTDLGCGVGCDFCITYALYKRNYIIPKTAQDIKDGLLRIAQKVNAETKSNDISIILTDPLAFKDEKLWTHLIDLIKGENYSFHLNILCSSSLLKKYSAKGRLLDRFQKSEELEISFVEIGLESLIHTYPKNAKIDWKHFTQMLKDRGIMVALSIIIGYDFHDRKSALKDVETAISFEPAILHPVNLRILHETNLWYKYLQENRLLEVPPEFRVLWGYQAYLHPTLKPGFKDCLPLMMEIDDIIRSNIPNIYESALEIIKNRRMTPYTKRLLQIGSTLRNLKKRQN